MQVPGYVINKKPSTVPFFVHFLCASFLTFVTVKKRQIAFDTLVGAWISLFWKEFHSCSIILQETLRYQMVLYKTN